MDFGRSGNEFWHTWWPRGSEKLNSPAFELSTSISTRRNELQHPVRTVTSTVRIQGADLPRLPVKTDRPLAKEKIFDCMALLNTITADAPVHVGDVLAADILGTDVNIVATKTM